MNTEVSPTPDEQGQLAEPAMPDALSQGAEAESPAAGVNTDSPSDVGVNTSLMDIARMAIAPEQAPSDSPSDETGQEPETEPETTDEFTDEELGLIPEKDASEAEREDLDTLPFGKHPRFREIIQERNEARTKVQEYEADAGQYRTMRKYLDQMEISEEDAAQAIILAAQLKHAKEGRYDAEKVLQTLAKMQSDISTRAGKALPPDIQERVDEGLIDDDTAKELAQARLFREEADQAKSKLDVRETDDETKQRIRQFTDTATRWESAVKARDPDYERKKEAIADYVKTLRYERGNPTTPDEVLVLLRDAYRTVNTRFGRMIPKPEPKAPGLMSDRSHAPESPRSQPNTLLEAARRGLEEARSRSL